MKRCAVTLWCVWALAGCSFYARGKDDYQRAVRDVLDGQSARIAECYGAELGENGGAQGKVVVQFTVAPKTGAFRDVQVVKGATTANKPLQKCVLAALEGLTLDPPDQRAGDATYTWEFAR